MTISHHILANGLYAVTMAHVESAGLARSCRESRDEPDSGLPAGPPGIRGPLPPGQPSSSLACANALAASSRSAWVWAAETCVLILALPTGTTG